MNELDMRCAVHRSVDVHCAGARPDPYRVQKVLAQTRRQEERRRRDMRSLAAMFCLLMVVAGVCLMTLRPRPDHAHRPATQPESTQAPRKEIEIEEAFERGTELIIAAFELTEDDLAMHEGSAEQYEVKDAPGGRRWLVSLECYDPETSSELDRKVTGQYAVALDVWGDVAVAPREMVKLDEAFERGKEILFNTYGLTEDDLLRHEVSVDWYQVSDDITNVPGRARWLVNLVCYEPEFFQKREQEAVVNAAYAVTLDIWGDMVGQPRAVTREATVSPGPEENPLTWAKARYEAHVADARLADPAATDEFWTWPHEVKAAYSAEVWPVMMTIEHGPAYIMASTTYRYGLPGGENLSRDTALDIAWRTVADISAMDPDDVQRFSIHQESFDVTDVTAPLWKFIITPADTSWDVQYLVYINALTGDVIRAEGFQREVPRSTTSQDYAEKWYY